MRQGPSPRLIGIFIIGAVVLAVAGVMAFASGDLMARKYPFVVYFEQSVAGLEPGAQVKFMGVQVGAVKAVTLNISGRSPTLADVRIPVILEIDERLLVQQGVVGLLLEDVDFLGSWIDQGLRVEMGIESFVTGKKFLSLVVRPDAPISLVRDPMVPYLELPSIRTTGIDDLESDVREALGTLVRLDVDGVLNSMMKTLEGIDRFVSSDLAPSADRLSQTLTLADSSFAAIQRLATAVEAGIEPVQRNIAGTAEEASTAVAELRVTLEAFRAFADPRSPVVIRLEDTLERLGAASRAVETLAEYLARNPGALIRGKPEGN